MIEEEENKFLGLMENEEEVQRQRMITEEEIQMQIFHSKAMVLKNKKTEECTQEDNDFVKNANKEYTYYINEGYSEYDIDIDIVRYDCRIEEGN